MGVAVHSHLSMGLIAGFEPVSYYGWTFVVPEGKYSQEKYTTNTKKSSVTLAYWIQSLSFETGTPVQTRVLEKSNDKTK